MRTRMVRVRRRPGGLLRAMIFLVLAMALYIRATLPGERGILTEAASEAPDAGRVTREAVLEAMELHLVSFGGFAEDREARVEAARYVSRGAAGYIMEAERYYVIGAGYARLPDAERACVHLESDEGMTCEVISLYAPAVRLRMTADSGRIQAFIGAQQMIRSSAGLMGQLSFSIDRGETSARQALGVIGRQTEEAKEAARRMQGRSGEAEAPVVGAYRELLGELTERMEEIGSAESAMELSSRLKHLHIEFGVREIELMNGL